MLFDANATGVSNCLCLNFDEESSILACFLTQLPPACQVSYAQIWKSAELVVVVVVVVVPKRRFSMILDTDLHLFLSGSPSVDGDFTA